jgi:hypothetical protein
MKVIPGRGRVILFSGKGALPEGEVGAKLYPKSWHDKNMLP